MGVHTENNCGCGGTGSGTTPEQPGNEFAQNNVGRKLNAGIFTIAPQAGSTYDYAVTSRIAAYFNTVLITITEIETPVVVYAVIFTAGGVTAKTHKLFFYRGKGKYGLGATPVVAGDFEIFDTQNLLINDITDGNAYVSFIDLDNLPDGDYLTAANSAERDFTDPTLTYFITYNKDGKSYLLKFDGELGSYGGSYPDSFIMENFLPASDSDVEPVLTKTSQLINDGDGESDFATLANVNGLSLIVNQAAALMYLKNTEGQTLATVNLAFLNNEGTTFFYNEATQKLQLKNDAGDILSEVPVSAFVSNLIQSVEFNGASPYLLEFKDATGNVVDNITVTINNVQGLQAALNNKANRDGSNVVPFSNWDINVTSAGSAEQFGDAYGDFLNDGAGQTHAVGYDSVSNKVKRYTALSFRTWLAVAITDVSGLATALANITSTLAGKANLTGDNILTGVQIIKKIGVADQWNLETKSDGSFTITNAYQSSTASITFNPDGTVSINRNQLYVLAGTTPESAVNLAQLNTKATIGATLTVNSTLIDTGADLNLYNSTGLYFCQSNAVAASGTNFPIGGVTAGKLEVVKYGGNNTFYQTYHTYSDVNRIFYRACFSGSFSDWKMISDDSTVLHKDGNEPITGIKTFNVSPVVPNGVNPGHVVNKSQLDAIGKPYKVYTARILQNSTNDPTLPTILENQFGVSPVLTRSIAGRYTITFPTGTLSATKTTVGITNYLGTSQDFKIKYLFTGDTIQVVTYNASNTEVDGALNGWLEIRVYN